MTDAIPLRNPLVPASRRRRLSEKETEKRMLQAAVDMVHESGLTVSLDHINFEDVIRDAEVSRSGAYRRWPYKEQFFADLLQELVKQVNPTLTRENEQLIDAVSETMLMHLDWLGREGACRKALFAEALREGALGEFDEFSTTPEWRTYYALQSTYLSLPEGELRQDIEESLCSYEKELNEAAAYAYQKLSELLGLRLVEATGADFGVVARMANALIRGAVVMRPTSPEIGQHRVLSNPFGAPEKAEWSEPAMALATVVLGFLEPDPAWQWCEGRRAEAEQMLRDRTWVFPGPAA